MSIFYIIIILVICGYIIYGAYMAKEHKKQIDKNWSNYKCKPYIIPLAGWFIGPKSVSNVDNFFNCIFTLNKEFFEILISPVLKVIDKILDSQNFIVKDIQNIRKALDFIRTNIESISKDIYNKIYDTYKRIAYLIKKIKKLLGKTLLTFKSLINALTYAFYTLASIWNGPIGATTRFFCFSEDTLIETNGKLKNIKFVNIGDMNKDNKITSIMKFTSNNTNMYNHNGIIVSGAHLVKIKDKWVRISEISNKINYDGKYIYCFETNTNQININNTIYSDYTESPIVNRIFYNIIITYLNKYKYTKKKISCINDIKYKNYVYENIYIKLYDNKYKKINEIKINDKLINNSVVTGIIKSKVNYDLYSYGDLISTKDTLIKHFNKWIPISKVGKKFNNNVNIYMYQLFTDSNLIETLGGTKFRDYELTNNVFINNLNDKYCQKYLNFN